MKCPESTTTVRSSGSIASSAIVSVRGSRRALSSYGTWRQAPASISSRERGGAAARGVAVERRDERLGGRGGVADDAGVDRPVRADRLLVAVDLHDTRGRGEQRAVARGPLVQRGAERDHGVGLAEQARRRRATRSRRRCRGRTGRPRTGRWRPPRWRARRRSLAEAAQRRPGARQHRAAARDDRRPLGRLQDRRPPPRTAACPGAAGASSGPSGARRRVAVGGLHVERQHQHDGAPLDPRAAHGTRDVGHRGVRPVHPLRDGADRLDQARLVDPEVRPQRRGGRVGGEHQQRRAALGRLGQPGDRVREPGSLVHAAGGDPPAHAPVAVGHADRAALVARAVEPRAAVAQRVRERQVAAAEQPEDDVDRRALPAPSRPPRRRARPAVSGRSVGTAARRPRRGSRRGPRSSQPNDVRIARIVPTTNTTVEPRCRRPRGCTHAARARGGRGGSRNGARDRSWPRSCHAKHLSMMRQGRVGEGAGHGSGRSRPWCQHRLGSVGLPRRAEGAAVRRAVGAAGLAGDRTRADRVATLVSGAACRALMPRCGRRAPASRR